MNHYMVPDKVLFFFFHLEGNDFFLISAQKCYGYSLEVPR